MKFNKYPNLPECLKTLKNARRELVNVYKIESHCIGSQRKIDAERCRKIGENWLEIFVTDPIIGYDTKTGIYHEPSGQHTSGGYIWRIENGYEESALLWCRVIDDPTKEQLNAIFLYEALMREPQKQNAILLSAWNANDPFVHNLSSLLNWYGYTISCNKNGNHIIKCISTLYNFSNEEINNILEFSSFVFPTIEKGKNKEKNACATEATFLKAINLFLKLYKDKFDLKKMKEIFTNKEIFAKDIKKAANNLDRFNKKPVVRILYMLVKTYNSGVRKNKLSYMPFEEYD